MASSLITTCIIFVILSFHSIPLIAACPSISTFKSCLPAAKNPNINVDPTCCSLTAQYITDVDCLCSSFNSWEAKLLGIHLQYVMSIPERCSISSRPIGYVCHGYSMP